MAISGAGDGAAASLSAPRPPLRGGQTRRGDVRSQTERVFVPRAASGSAKIRTRLGVPRGSFFVAGTYSLAVLRSDEDGQIPNPQSLCWRDHMSAVRTPAGADGLERNSHREHNHVRRLATETKAS